MRTARPGFVSFSRLGWLAWLALGACASPSHSSLDDPKDFVGSLVRHLCEAERRCALTPTFDPSACVASATASYEDGKLGYILEAVARGKTTYDAHVASDCVGSLDDLVCGGSVDGRTFCSVVFLGTGKVGDVCATDEECGTQLFCDTGLACPGKCARQAALGEACDTAECELGLCCLNDTCTKNLAKGAACSGSSAACDTGMFCLRADGTRLTSATDEGTCQDIPTRKLGKLGDTCGPDYLGVQCEPDAACVPNELQTESTCQKRVAAAQKCRAAYPNACAPDHYCTGTFDSGDGNGVCRALPKAGEACTDNKDFLCGFGLACFADKHCHPPGRGGDACATDDECAGQSCIANKCVVTLPCQ